MCKITSWNCNGLKGLCTTYGSLDKALSTLQSDIICFQETKLASVSSLRSEVCISEDYFSFFSICSYSNRHEKAYSGTATFVRKTLPVFRAQEGLTGRISTTKQPKQSEDNCIVYITSSEVNLTEEELLLLDSEGRCVITDHGDFILLNIYAPNAHSSNIISATPATSTTTGGDVQMEDSGWEVSFETDVAETLIGIGFIHAHGIARYRGYI
jgi:AP endonuclease 2